MRPHSLCQDLVSILSAQLRTEQPNDFSCFVAFYYVSILSAQLRTEQLHWFRCACIDIQFQSSPPN